MGVISRTEESAMRSTGIFSFQERVHATMARLILKLWDRQSRTEDNLDQMYKNQEALSNRA